MLDFRVDTFIMVCKYMNYTKAASELCITQPAVTQHIKSLESYYGVKLFSYKGKKLSLTDEGRELYIWAVNVKNDDNCLKNHFQDMKDGIKRLDFGVTLTIGEFVIPGHLGRYMKSHSDTRVNMRIANTRELLKELSEGGIDFAFVEGFFNKEEYDYITFSHESYIAVCSPRNELLKEKTVSINDVFTQTLISREQGSGSREILERYLSDNNNSIDEFHGIIEMSNINSIKQMVIDNTGIAFMYRKAAREELDKGLLSLLSIEGFDVTHDFTFIWRKNSNFSKEYKAIYTELIGGRNGDTFIL